jgi:hypothetical protein
MTHTTCLPIPERKPVVARFERWLQRRGYEPMFDPFAPEPDGCNEAAALVLEYLIDRPEDAKNQALLLRHAREVGGVALAM